MQRSMEKKRSETPASASIKHLNLKSHAGSRFLFQGDFSGAETFRAFPVRAQNERAFVVDAHGRAAYIATSLGEGDRLAAQHVVTMPFFREGLVVAAIDELFVRVENTPDQRCGELVQVDRRLRVLSQRNCAG